MKDYRKKLCQELEFFGQTHPEQEITADEMAAFISGTWDCFERSHTSGHITGSAWLVNPGGDKVLMTLHRKLKRWMQTGGHADGNPEPLLVALREAEEESGIRGISPIHTEIFDIDIHLIPERKATQEPAHLHYDIRYLLQAPHEHFCISPESDALEWWGQEDFLRRKDEVDASVLRMASRYFEQ